MILELVKHTLIFRHCRTVVQRALLCIVVVLVTTPLVSAAIGIRMDLQMPQPLVASISPDKPEIGISKSLDSIPLLKADNIQPRLTFNYDAASQLLIFNQAYGKFQNVTLPATASPASYRRWLLDCQSRRLWRDGYSSQAKKAGQGAGGSLLQFQIPFEVPRIAKSIMGEGGAGLKVNGYRKISFSGRSQWDNKNLAATHKQSKFPSLNMEQQSSFTISGNIGSKIFVDVNQDSKRQQSLANRIQLRYKGDEDDVIKTVELGNTNLSLPGTRFTGYSRQIQGLFGVKTTAELGGLKLTAIASQEKSSNQGASFKAGTESQTRVIRDNQFLDMTYFDLARLDTVNENDLQPGDSITELELYFSVRDDDANYTTVKHTSNLFVDPFDTTKYDNENVRGTFVSFAENSSYSNFYFHPMDHYVIMSQPITSLSVGAYIKFRRVRGIDTTYNEIGSIPANSTYTLKLIANANPQPYFVTWNYVWRNVYSLGGRIDDPDNLQVKIFKGAATNTTDRDVSDPENQQGTSYIKLLGLDSDNNGQIDSRNEQIVDLARGHLRFPNNRKPFADAKLEVREDSLYLTKSTSTAWKNATKYYFLVNSTSRESDFYLGHSDIVLESETVTLNGKPLKKDVDYRIYYDLGRISFLNQAALDPGADVKVDYEYSPLIAAEKKTLLGARAEYQVGSNLKMGTTVLYKSEKTTDRKPRLGEEQTKSLNLDADISYAFQSNLLTKMVDALPFVETNVPSQISINGEVARSVPNSNTSGEAYVDDFEGAREQLSLGVTREGWHRASMPVQKQTPLTKPGQFIWYNPYDQVRVTDIYDRQTKAGEDHVNVLVMRLTPSGSDHKSSWGGVMKALSKGSYDQSNIQFIELRMRGSLGVLHLDLGEITEDLPDSSGLTNGKFDTEDRNKNGLLDAQYSDEDGVHINEDTGLDLMPDSAEQRVCNCPDSPNFADPHGDDWDYHDPRNYEHINGTENNGNDPGTNGRPDSEDLNGSGGLDDKNNYYSYSIDLAAGENVVPNSERIGTGWYTVRIPFTNAFVKDFVTNNPNDTTRTGISRGNITNVRLWIDGVDADTAYVEIADLKLVRNVWEAQPTLPTTTAVRGDSAGLSATVVNTEENVNYYSPPGVAGFYDQVNNLQEKEQSLSLDYRELLPGDTAYAEKIPYKVDDLTSYRKLAMWVHGDSASNSVSDSVEFFFRFGPDADNYYEYRTTIDSGWSTHNSVDITFDDMTQLKLIPKDTTSDSTHIPEPVDPHYRVFGSPSLTRVKYYAMGVVNLHTSESQKQITGELWVDELRTAGVRNDRGMAAVASTSISLGDVGSFRSDYSKQDAFFRNLTTDRSNLGSGSSGTNYGYYADMRLDKFLSSSEKASIPVGYSWRRTESSPRLITGSDIVVTPAHTEEQKSVSTTTHFQIGESWNKQTRNILYGALLNRFNSNFSYDKTIGRTPMTPDYETERYTLKGRYAVNSPIKRGLKLLSWLRGMPLLPKRVLGTEFNPFPLRASLDGTVNRTLESSTNSFGTETNRYLRTFQGRFETGFNPLNSVDVNYSFTTDRDLGDGSDPTLLKFSFDPKQAKLGTERQYSQSFSTNYSPQILPFVTGTKFGYTVNHTETVVLTSTSANEIGTRRADNNRSFTANATLDLQRLLGKNQPSIKKTPPKEPPAQKKGKGEIVSPDSTGKKDKGKLHDLPATDSTRVPSLDSLRQGPGGPNLPESPAADTLRDTTKTVGGKKSSNLPSSTGQTFAVVFAGSGPDSGQSPSIPTTPPKDEQKGDIKPPPAIPQVVGDTVLTKPDSVANKGNKGTGVGAETPKNKVPTKSNTAKSDSTKVGHDSTAVKTDGQKGKPKIQELPGTPFYAFGLQFIHLFTDRVDPIGGSFHREKRQSLAGFVQRPSFFYRIGFSDNPNADRILPTSSSSQTDLISTGQGYSFRSGVRLILGIKVATSYAHNSSEATGKATRDESTTYPDLTFTFGKLDYLLIPRLFSNSLSLDSKYSRQQGTSISKQYGKLKSRSTSINYSPLVSIKVDWKLAQGLQSTFNYSRTISESEGFTDSTGAKISDVKDFANTLTIKTSYSFRGGSKLWLPLFGRIKIQSTLTFDMDISRRLNRTIDYNPKKPIGLTAERTDFSVVPSITYNFSTNIKGGMSGRWQDSYDRNTKTKSHVRELSFWAEIRF
jgi:hypothetical protein